MDTPSKDKNANEIIKEVLQKDSVGKKEIYALLKSFSSTLRKIPLYPISHPMIKDSINELKTFLSKFFETYGDFNLNILDNNILLCDQPLEDISSIARDLLSYLKKLRIEGLMVKKGIEEAELEKFLRLFTLKLEMIEAKGGVKKMMQDEQIVHIQLIEVRYARILDDETVAKKDTVGPGGGAGDGEGKTFPGQPVFSEMENKDIVGMVSNFLSGNSHEAPAKEIISFGFKKHARTIVKQLLKLIGPEKAVEEVIRIIEEKFGQIGLTDEERAIYVEKINKETIKLKEPKVSKKQLETEFISLREENKEMRKKLAGLDKIVQHQVSQATQTLELENKKIKKEKERINSVLKNVAEGLVIVDNDGKVLLLNPAAEKLLGVTKEDKIGKNILDGLKDEYI